MTDKTFLDKRKKEIDYTFSSIFGEPVTNCQWNYSTNQQFTSIIVLVLLLYDRFSCNITNSLFLERERRTMNRIRKNTIKNIS